MKALTYTLYKEHCELYTEILGSIAVKSYQVELEQKDIILLSNVFIIFYKAGKHTSVENNKFIHFNLLTGTFQLTILIQKSMKQSHRKDRTLSTTSN